MPENFGESGHLEKLEKKLSSAENKVPPMERTRLKPRKFSVNEDWGETLSPDGGNENEQKEKHTDIFADTRAMRKEVEERKSLFAKIFIASLVFFLGAAGVAAYLSWSGRNVLSPGNVSVSLFGPLSVKGGDELALQVVMENSNSAPLRSVRLSVTLPEGTRSVLNPSEPFSRFVKELDDFAPGEVRTETIRIVLLGDEKSRKEIRAALNYAIEGSGAKYVANGGYTVSLSEPPVRAAASLLDEANAGQEITLTAHFESISSSLVERVLAQIDYPAGFLFQSAVPAPTFGNNVWALGDMQQGNKRDIEVRGILRGEDEERKTFWVRAGLAKEDTENSLGILFSVVPKTVALKKPFLGVEVFVNHDGGGEEYLLPDRKREIRTAISWANNLPSKITEGQIEVSLRGASIDWSSVRANNGGYFRLSNKMIFWESRTTPELSVINSGERKSVEFSFFLVRPSSGGGAAEKNPEASFEVSVRGTRLSENNVPEEVRSLAKKTIKIGTELEFTPRAVHFSGPFKNTGPMPPRVEQDTTYAVIWTIRNFSSDVSGGKVRALLPPTVRFTGTISPETAALSYNEVSHEIVWDIGKIPAGAGGELPEKEAAFQIAFSPNQNQISTTKEAELLSNIVFTGTDDFTGLPMEKFYQPLTTLLPTDPQFVREQGFVAP